MLLLPEREAGREKKRERTSEMKKGEGLIIKDPIGNLCSPSSGALEQIM